MDRKSIQIQQPFLLELLFDLSGICRDQNCDLFGRTRPTLLNKAQTILGSAAKRTRQMRQRIQAPS